MPEAQFEFLTPADIADRGGDFEVALLSRDIAGTSASDVLSESLVEFYAAMRASQTLRWVQLYSAGADRAVYRELYHQGVTITTAAGTTATEVAHSAIAGMLALARRFPLLMQAQRDRRWASLHREGLPQGLAGSHALVVGFGPIGKAICGLLEAFGVKVSCARRTVGAPDGADFEFLTYDGINAVVPRMDWIFIACPLTPLTRKLVGKQVLGNMKPSAAIINVARGGVIDQDALIERLLEGRLGGAFLDVFEVEPLPADSPLWSMPNVMVTPHSASHTLENAGRVRELFVQNLGRFMLSLPMENEIRLS